jgi:CO/xanthine dehydrogenase Mo-binding subunit
VEVEVDTETGQVEVTRLVHSTMSDSLSS